MAKPDPEHSQSEITQADSTAKGEAPHHRDKEPPTVVIPSGTPPPTMDETLGYVPPSVGGPVLGVDEMVLGEYELLAEIARGGMGVVYKARHRKLNRVVALKVLQAGRRASAEEAQRFQVEAEAAAKLDHPHIVPIYEVGQVNGLHFFSMAFVEGESLGRRAAEQPLAPREAAGLIRQVADAVAYAHSQGVIHRDLKPANILQDASGQPRVTDFGLAKHADADSSLTQAGQVMGSPSYMSPEQAEGKNEQVGPLSDVYSLGATLYCLVTGRPPFQSASVVDTLKQVVEREPASPRFVNPAVDRDLNTIVLKCLQKRPEKRYASATALAEDLQHYLEKRPIQARPVGQIERLFRWCGRNPLQAVSLAGIVAIFVTAFVLVSGSYVQAEKARRLAEQREKDERWERYRANMIAIGSAMQLHNVTAAQSSLAAAPEEHRNWEWNYFSHQLDTAQHVIRVGDDIRVIGVSPDGTIAAVQSAGGSARLWDLVQRQETGMLPNQSPAAAFYFSPDSKIIASVERDRLLLWDVAARRERAVVDMPAERVNYLNFSPNGMRVAAGFLDRTPRVFDTETGRQLLVLRGHKAAVHDATFSPDGRTIATVGGPDRTVRLWDAETGQIRAVLSPHDSEVSQAHFSPQGDRVLTVEEFPGNKLRLWDAAMGKLLKEMPGHTNTAQFVAFSPDGTRIASGGLDRSIRLWDGRTGEALWSREGHRGAITNVAFSPDGKYLLTGSLDQTARLWDALTGEPLGVLHGHTGAISEWSAHYAPDGRTIVTASAADGTVRIWDARRAEWNGALRGHESFVYSVDFHPDGERVASAAWDGTVRIWDATTGHKRARFHHGSEKTILSFVAFHPLGNLVASFGRDGAVRFWDLAASNEAFCLQMPPECVYNFETDSRVAFNSRGSLLAVPGGHENTVHIWDIERRADVGVLKGHEDAVRVCCFSPDDRWLASGGNDRTVRIWDVAKRETIQTLARPSQTVNTLVFSRNGKWLASGTEDGAVRLWDTQTWNEIAVLRHGTNIYGVAFSPDGTRLASACGDNLIRFWDMKTFQLVAELDGHTAYVHQVVFSPDGTRLVSGSGDHTVRIWDTLSIQERSARRPVSDGK